MAENELSGKLSNAIETGDVEEARKVIRKGIEVGVDINKTTGVDDPRYSDRVYKSFLYSACEGGKIGIVIELLSHPKIDVNLGLKYVKSKSYQEPVSGLWRGGWSYSHGYKSPLVIAFEGGHLEIANELLCHPAINLEEESFVEYRKKMSEEFVSILEDKKNLGGATYLENRIIYISKKKKKKKKKEEEEGENELIENKLDEMKKFRERYEDQLASKENEISELKKKLEESERNVKQVIDELGKYKGYCRTLVGTYERIRNEFVGTELI